MEHGRGVAVVEVPCTCGELVQGILEGEPFLVSCPIDRPSRVSIALGVESFPAPASATKAREAAAAALRLLGHGETPFALDVSCPLPPAKGFGSSTADVVGAIAAAATAVGSSLNPPEVARLAVSVEPSDGTMFPGLAFFNHRSARGWEPLGPAPPLLVVVLEFEGTVDTLAYNAELDLERLGPLAPKHGRALGMLRQGLREGRWDLVGRAATLSATIHQQLLPKPQLEPVMALGADFRALGVCVAHSGTALGVLFAPEDARAARRLLDSVDGRLEGLCRSWVSRMVGGGARVVGAADVHHEGKKAQREG